MDSKTANGLPRVVGYPEVCEALGVTRRTLERMVRDRKFPSPIQLSSNRVGWTVDVALDWLREREARVLASSFEDFSKVDPEQLADGTARLGAALLSGPSGERVRPEDVRIGRIATSAEREAILRASWQARHEYVSTFEALDFLEALFVVHGLFPAMHDLTNGVAERAGF
ncbi:helix-turn-helix transcriptional regulator, partial [Methyloceanibacter sp.]|uniref:helix-turn-helix transcriptional regulator n=1 Tax=Methyloceanibacter sp. TaxID=1965321 RepID=UPI00351AE796